MKLQSPQKRFFRHDEFGTCRAHLSRAGVRRLVSLRSIAGYRFPGAIRPDPAVAFTPQEGFREEVTEDGLPRIVAAASGDRILDLFLDSVAALGPYVFAIIEDASTSGGADYEEYFSVELDNCVLRSYLVEFQSLVLHDGCLGVSVFDKSMADEIRLDVHKNLQIVTEKPKEHRVRLESLGLRLDPDLRLVSELPHYHCTSSHHGRQLEMFKTWLQACPDPLIREE